MLKVISTVLFIFLCSQFSQGQVANINSSIKVIGSEAFYMHEILEGQEIEMISEAYGADIPAILASNPKIRTGIKPGMILKVPFAVGSAERMSKIPPPDTSRANSPIQEAVRLLQDEATKQQVSETKTKVDDSPGETELAQLAALSQSISEGLSALTELKSVIEETPTEKEADAKPTVSSEPYMAEAKGGIGDFLDQFATSYLGKNDTCSSLTLKEYFIIRLNEQGQITNVKDERTETNENSMYLNPEEVKGHLLIANEEVLKNKILPLGLHYQARRISYSLKVKKTRLRVFNDPLYVEHMAQESKHNTLLRQYAIDNGISGKCDATIVETKRFVSFQNAFEYNPFGLTDTLILVKDSAYVERMFSP
ncbi:MAG: hypothetical protein GWP27_11145 [Bacteroidetes bacterium]|nr:hypothetical protein [Bacteroidota bacterium]